jgi:peptidoglycan/LPS O-acetylase OafA/YrhL
MKKNVVFVVIGLICIVAAIVMHSFRNDSHLSELGDFFWMPLIPGVLMIVLGLKKNS